MKQGITTQAYLPCVLTTRGIDNCPVRRTLELLSGKWRTHIIYELCKHPLRRFGEVKRAVPRITNTLLTNTLHDLERLGIVHRESA